MERYNLQCEACGCDVLIRPYEGGKCPRCHALYDYDEGVSISLGEVVSLDLEKGEVTFKIRR